jgi:hypothetical protein
MQLLVLPQSSVAVQVRVMVLSCGQVPATVTSVKLTAGETSQASLAVADPVLAGSVLAVHSIVTSGGQDIEGGALSSIWIVCVQLLELPQSSVAVHVLVITPPAAQPPGPTESVKFVVGVASQLSDVVGLPVFAGSVLAVHSIVTLGGQMIDGARLSSTTMVWTQELELPQSSVAVHVLVIVNSWGQAPPMMASVKLMVGVRSQSVAVADPVLAGAVLALHSMVTFGGQVMAGATLSSTTMVWTQELELPQSSIAVHVLVMVYS